ncbi:phosphatase PAP2 family protein [Brachybacterium sp. MASK1Z-5]|uniref:Phosphatase PAP2 family protein n=1 Tax=Brachybacterium halotolerans TaxID=2795215 RepID=A0ABS1B884_9MICO|nr:phosphatase PAP2 family protein [Brachybacterium halotolerans]MBK0330810.1 phosphatase PAP2 family protein [Brachybacterium halotolerans]
MRISPVRWLIAGVSLALFLLVFYLSGWVGPTESLDIRMLTSLRTDGNPALLWIVSVPWLILCSIVVIAIGIRRGRAMDGLRAFALLALCNVLGQVLKKVVLHRDSIVLMVDNTYPSGHMIAFASVALALRIVLPRRMRRAFTVIAAIVLCLVAFELVYYGWHRPSDVIGSLLLVTAVGVLGGGSRGTEDEDRPEPVLPPGA